jgi:transposase-like protein
MARTCTVCAHAQREAIDAALVAGASYRDVAGQYGLSKSAVERHKTEHIPGALTQAHGAEEMASADTLLQKIASLEADAKRIGKAAEAAEDFRSAIAAVRELIRIVELLARLEGQLREQPTINVLVMPEWLTLRSAIYGALQPFPEARVAVAGALQRIDGHVGA